MQVPTEHVMQLAQLLEHTLNPDPTVRKNAEAQLKGAEKTPNYSLVLMTLVKNQSIPPQIRLSGALALKNFVRTKWENEDELKEPERAQIKQNALDLMLSTTGNIQTQMSGMISIICEYDFHQKWPQLLPELISKMATNDFQVIRCLLLTANSIFKKYRDQSKTDEIENELVYIVGQFAQPMLQLFTSFYQTLNNAQFSQNEAAIKLIFDNINLLLQIFYSLNWVDLPEFFEDHMNEFFSMFHGILIYSNVFVETSDDDSEAGLLDISKSLITEIVNLYLEKYDEEFEKLLPQFAADIWDLLSKASLTVKHDRFVSKALSFLTTISRGGKQSFLNEQTITTICERIIVPNVTLREDDIEMFEDDPIEYIRRDIEGSDSETRRRAASELIRGLCIHYESQVTNIFVRKVGELLSQASPDNWQPLDVAIYLVTALSVKGQTRGKGATQINPLVPVHDFLLNQILPQLSNRDVNSLPIVKADALKFLCIFRQHLSKELFHQFFPLVVNVLTSKERVVHTYAAWCIEKMLSVKDTTPDQKTQSRYTKDDIKQYTQQLLTNLFSALQYESSTENEYIMKAIMRVTAVLKEEMAQLMGVYIEKITSILAAVCKNIRNPIFNHYIFESYATVIKFNPQFVEAFENALFPAFMSILESDIQEFTPYVFQIFSQLLELRPAPIPDKYQQLLPRILDFNLWSNEGNIPGLVNMVTGFLAKDRVEIMKQENLHKVLGIFRKLVNMKSHDHHGFVILDAVILHAPKDIISASFSQIFSILFARLQTRKTIKFQRCLVLFFSLFTIKHRASSIISVIEGIQAGLFSQILKNVWLAGLPKISGKKERKTCSVALTRLTFEPLYLASPDAGNTISLLLKENLNLLEVPENVQQDIIEEEEQEAPSFVQDESGAGYKVAFAKLSFASKSEQDPASDVQDARIHLAQVLHSTLSSADNNTKQLIMHGINSLLTAQQQQLQGYLNAAGLQI